MADARPEPVPLLQAVGGPSWASDAATAPAVVLLLHGYGADERDLLGLIPELGIELPWASLRAPIELANGGAAWFAMTSLDDPDPALIAAATDTVWAWVDEFVGPATRVVPIGFSQGGCMATQLLRTRPERVLAPVVLAGFALGAQQPADELLATERPPVFWGRGDADGVITPEAVARTAAFLPAHTTLDAHVYPGLGHGIGAAELADVQAFLAAHL